MATNRSIIVNLITKTAKFDQGMKKASRRLNDFGRTMTRRVTLPLVAAGGAAVKFAVDFDKEMTKVVTLVGVADEQVNKWRKDILAMAPAVGKGPGELARTLFVVTSAGERGANALKIVERAAKASALGLGDTAETARAVTAAMQAYSSSGLTAARATEILVATVREGNLRAEDLSGSLGRVLGVASQVGVTFEQVGGFIATFTRLGVSAEEASTALRQILVTLVKPTKQAAVALEAVGLSSEMLRRQAGEEGLQPVLKTLIEAFEGNQEALSQVIPNVRALSGVLGTAGSQGEQFAEINKNIANSLGIVDEGFERVRRTPAQKWAEFTAQAQKMAIEIGDKLIPTFERMLKHLADASRWFTDLTPAMQDAVVVSAALAAALGPLALALGALSKAAALASGAIVALGTSWNVVVGGFAGGLGPFIALAAALGAIELSARNAEHQIDRYTNASIRATEWTGNLADKIRQLKATSRDTFDLLKDRVDNLVSEKGISRTQAWALTFTQLGRGMAAAAKEPERPMREIARITGVEIPAAVEVAEKSVNKYTDAWAANQVVLREHARTMEADIPPAVDVALSATEKMDRFLEDMALNVASRIASMGISFRNLGNMIIDSLKRVMINNWVKKFIGWISGFAAGGGILGTLATVLGFHSGGTVGAGRVGPSSGDVVPAMLTPGERVVPASQPTSAAQGVGSGGMTLNLTVNTIGGSKAQGRMVSQGIVELLRENGYEIARG